MAVDNLPEDLDRRAIPAWAVHLVQSASKTEAIVAAMRPELTEVRLKLEGFVTRDEYGPRHKELSDKVEVLMRVRDQQEGAINEQRRNAIRDRWIVGAVLLAISVWVGLHTGHVNITF